MYQSRLGNQPNEHSSKEDAKQQESTIVPQMWSKFYIYVFIIVTNATTTYTLTATNQTCGGIFISMVRGHEQFMYPCIICLTVNNIISAVYILVGFVLLDL